MKGLRRVKNLFSKNLPAIARTLPVTDLFSNKLFARWLPVMRQTPVHRMAMAAAGLAVTATAVAGPALAFDAQPHHVSGTTSKAAGQQLVVSTQGGTGAAAAPAEQANVAGAQPADGASQDAQPAAAQPAQANQPATKGQKGQKGQKAEKAKPAKPGEDDKAKQAKQAQQVQATKQSLESSLPRDKEVSVDYQPQSTFFYCGPAATRIVASAQGHNLSQDDVATQLGTTVNGTPSAVDTTRVLNGILGGNSYHTTSVPDRQPSQTQADQVQVDMMRSLNGGRAVVANIAGATTDVTGATHDFPGGHYVAVVGYHDQGGTVEISDPADVNGADSYWISTSNLTNWMATRGYSSAG
jgi:hypothetical protein